MSSLRPYCLCLPNLQAGGAVKDLKKQPNVSFTPAAMRGLQVDVGLGDNASFQGPEVLTIRNTVPISCSPCRTAPVAWQIRSWGGHAHTRVPKPSQRPPVPTAFTNRSTRVVRSPSHAFAPLASVRLLCTPSGIERCR